MMSGYNGWINYATRNIAHHIGNDIFWYHAAGASNNYTDFCKRITATETADNVSLSEGDDEELDELISEIRNG